MRSKSTNGNEKYHGIKTTAATVRSDIVDALDVWVKKVFNLGDRIDWTKKMLRYASHSLRTVRDTYHTGDIACSDSSPGEEWQEAAAQEDLVAWQILAALQEHVPTVYRLTNSQNRTNLCRLLPTVQWICKSWLYTHRGRSGPHISPDGNQWSILTWNLGWEFQTGKSRKSNPGLQKSMRHCIKRSDDLTSCSFTSARFINDQIDNHNVRIVCLQDVDMDTFSKWSQFAISPVWKSYVSNFNNVANVVLWDDRTWKKENARDLAILSVDDSHPVQLVQLRDRKEKTRSLDIINVKGFRGMTLENLRAIIAGMHAKEFPCPPGLNCSLRKSLVRDLVPSETLFVLGDLHVPDKLPKKLTVEGTTGTRTLTKCGPNRATCCYTDKILKESDLPFHHNHIYSTLPYLATGCASTASIFPQETDGKFEHRASTHLPVVLHVDLGYA